MRFIVWGRVDVAILQETKITKAKFTARSYRGYTIRVSPSSGKTYGRVGLVVRMTKQFTVENAKVIGPNAISFQFLTRKDKQWHVVGCYFPPQIRRGQQEA